LRRESAALDFKVRIRSAKPRHEWEGVALALTATPLQKSKKKGHLMSGKTMKYAAARAAAALGIAGAIAVAAGSSSPAASIVPAAASVKVLASTQVTDVTYRHGYYARRYYCRRFYRPGYAHSYWRHGYRYADCMSTFPATCAYPYPYFGFVYGWHGIW
jgi:hypothetical protein